uniref:C2H2-type domain-containing protein n=1 Tax=Ditylenchus dipsaci TaxID=166011 RepID=A0A915DS62_9BILA
MEGHLTKIQEIQTLSPKNFAHSHSDRVAIEPAEGKNQFSVYSVCPTAHNIADNNMQKEVCQASSSSDVSFQAVLYDGKEELNSGQNIEIPSNLLEICHKSCSPSEANYCPLTATVLRRIRRGEEVVVLHALHTIDAKVEEKNVKNKIAPKIFSTNHLVKNLLKPSEKYRRETTVPNVGSAAPSTRRHIQIQQEVGEVIKSEIIKEDKDHEKLPGYQCERCRKMFSYAYYRDKHLKYTRCVDNGDRKFPCPLCSRSFEKRDRLRIHVLHVHENHRPHVCSVCGKAFSQSSSLNKHLRVHSGERPYHCPHCTKSFTASSILRTHIRQHSGEKPFKCAFCGKSFASHAAHDSHVRRTHSALS